MYRITLEFKCIFEDEKSNVITTSFNFNGIPGDNTLHIFSQSILEAWNEKHEDKKMMDCICLGFQQMETIQA